MSARHPQVRQRKQCYQLRGIFYQSAKPHFGVTKLALNGVFQGSCRVNRLTMPLFSQPVALDPGSTARYRSVPSYAFDPTTVPAFSLWLVRTTHVAGPRPDGPVLDAVQSV